MQLRNWKRNSEEFYGNNYRTVANVIRTGQKAFFNMSEDFSWKCCGLAVAIALRSNYSREEEGSTTESISLTTEFNRLTWRQRCRAKPGRMKEQ